MFSWPVSHMGRYNINTPPSPSYINSIPSMASKPSASTWTVRWLPAPVEEAAAAAPVADALPADVAVALADEELSSPGKVVPVPIVALTDDALLHAAGTDEFDPATKRTAAHCSGHGPSQRAGPPSGRRTGWPGARRSLT